VTPDEPADPKPGRKPYEKPKLSQVALRPEEAVLGNCKSMSVAGPVEMDCGAIAGGCSTVGS
jgi:hypothetical protein